LDSSTLLRSKKNKIITPLTQRKFRSPSINLKELSNKKAVQEASKALTQKLNFGRKVENPE
jgi:hypothetical protein